MAASYEARAYGVHGAMGGRQARRLCPDLIAVPPRFDAYVEASEALFDQFAETAPVVEGLSMEEAFLDVGGLEHISGAPEEIASSLRRRVASTSGCPCRSGSRGRRRSRRWRAGPRSPTACWSSRPTTSAPSSTRCPSRACGGSARPPQGACTSSASRPSATSPSCPGWRCLVARPGDRDPPALRRPPRRPAPGARRAPAELVRVAVGMGRRTAHARGGGREADRARGPRHAADALLRPRGPHGGAAASVSDFKRATRSRTLAAPTASAAPVLLAARGLFEETRPLVRRRGLTMVGIAITNLEHRGAGEQLELPLGQRGGPGSTPPSTSCAAATATTRSPAARCCAPGRSWRPG